MADKWLIDANELLKKTLWYEDLDKDYEEGCAFKYIDPDDVENAPTVDAVEVVHGRWENFGEHRKMDLRCSVCNNRASKFVGGTEDWWDMWKPAYCPNCGAKMDGDGNG